MYAGVRYFLNETLELRDIRIVYAPAAGIGNFGGEVDNWRWPRQCGMFRSFAPTSAKTGCRRTTRRTTFHTNRQRS